MRRRVFFIVIVIIILIGVGLWKLGDTALRNTQAQENTQLQSVLAKENRAREAVESNLKSGEGLKRFDITTTPDPLTASDITLDSATSSDKAAAYGRALVIITKPLVLSATLPLQLQVTAYDQKDQAAEKQLANISQGFSVASLDLQNVVAPQDAQIAHLRLVNAIRTMDYILQNMAAVNTDPVLAFEAASYYTDAFTELAKALNFMNQFFISKNVSFGSEERIKVYVPSAGH